LSPLFGKAKLKGAQIMPGFQSSNFGLAEHKGSWFGMDVWAILAPGKAKTTMADIKLNAPQITG